MPKISGIVILIIIAIIGGNSREICTNLWQSILFILDIMNDVIMYVGITGKIIAAVIFVAILIVFAIAGVSVSKKKRNKIKSGVGTVTDVVFNIIDLIKVKYESKKMI